MPHSRRCRALGAALSGTAARRLLDGVDDGSSPLPQLLAAASAPATDAELQGEAAARAVFRSAVHATPVPVGGSRKARARTATAIVTAKIIAAVILTAGTAGGVALATNSYSAQLRQNPVVSGTDTATAGAVSPSRAATSTTAPSTQVPDGSARSDSSTAPGADDEAARGGTSPSVRSEALSAGMAGRCMALCTTKAAGLPVTPSGEPDQSTGNARAGNGKNTGNGTSNQEKNASSGNSDKVKNSNSGSSDKEKNINTGNSDKVKDSSSGNSSDEGKNAGSGKNGYNSSDVNAKNDKAGGNGPSDPGGKQTAAEQGSDKKKTDA
jgi:hypothetical protein